ncbi:ribosomal protein L10 [[Clostridium] methylpentosum DSM 5476]|uniref:Large ribosomal subunit protein uL10 n=1 Tax=[Clostridium] methylpentosum DSM 5476 TaxID=537013 RepID=C0EBE3_9FIRM|nr:ribosomal protein L10 [[Clostridium] methylpentosum DSM 5476]MDY3989949.1 50S ribosomal protein L10 [Massilioclostridium sp.]MEE1491425.1 50S ribosomal protein L10 [Massilioclostridium sp.]
MPSEKVLQSKKELVAQLTEKLKNAVAGVVIDYKGINVEQDTKMRKDLREAGVEYFVVKNTMLRFAAKEVGFDEFIPHLEGTTAIAISNDDVIAPAKVISKYAKELKDDTDFAVKVGFMDGKVIDAATVSELGNLPSKEQLVGQLLSVLIAPVRGMAVALNAIAEQKESA